MLGDEEAGEAGQHRAGHPGERRDAVDGDAEQAGRLAVLGRGPDGDAEAGPGEEEGDGDGDERDEDEALDVAAGDAEVADVEGRCGSPSGGCGLLGLRLVAVEQQHDEAERALGDGDGGHER